MFKPMYYLRLFLKVEASNFKFNCVTASHLEPHGFKLLIRVQGSDTSLDHVANTYTLKGKKYLRLFPNIAYIHDRLLVNSPTWHT